MFIRLTLANADDYFAPKRLSLRRQLGSNVSWVFEFDAILAQRYSPQLLVVNGCAFAAERAW